MNPADGALRTVLRPGLHGLTIAIRLEYLLGTQSNAEITCFAPTQVDFQRKRAFRVIVLTFRL